MDSQRVVDRVKLPIAKQLHDTSGQTESGMILGTPSYMAPEQAEGRSSRVGPPADIYGLGAILYEMLTGRPPFVAESNMETVLQLFQTEPVAPSKLQPKLPRDLETICLKCLQKDPQRRYASAEDLACDLQRFLASESILAKPPTPAEQLWKWSRRRPALAMMSACLFLGCVTDIGLVLLHQRDLQDKLGRALSDEREARQAQEAATQQVRLSELRTKANELLSAGESALAAQDWDNAQRQLTRVRDQVAEVPELADLQSHIGQLLRQTQQQQVDHARLKDFVRLRNEALFHATLFTGGDLASALQETRAVALEALADDHFERGRILHAQKDFSAALAAYDAALRLRPQDARVSRFHAETLLELNRLPEALRSLDDCLKFGPADAGAFRARAALRTRLGQYANAQADYTRALELDANGATYAARGWSFLVADAPKLALADFEESIRRAPAQSDAYAGRGLCRVVTGECQAAIVDAEETLRQGPESTRLFFNVSRIYAQAAGTLSRSAAQPRGLPTARICQERAVQTLARALAMQSDSDAKHFWQTIVATDPALNSIRQTSAYKQLAARYSQRDAS